MERWTSGYGAAGVFLFFGGCLLVAAVATGHAAAALLAIPYGIVAALFFFHVPAHVPHRLGHGLAERYAASQAATVQPAHLPLWSSPDNPPGWYLNPATNEPGYWSGLRWRS